MLFAPPMLPLQHLPRGRASLRRRHEGHLYRPVRSRLDKRARRRSATLPLVDNRLFNYEGTDDSPGDVRRRRNRAAVHAAGSDSRTCPRCTATCQRRAGVGAVRAAWMAADEAVPVAAHPERGTPAVVILKHRFILTPMPGTPAEWTQPVVERPCARWHPATGTFEAYDAINHRFVPAEAKP